MGERDLSKGGETAFYVLRTNGLSQLEVRPRFGRLGADLYFNEDGMPIMIVNPDGLKIWKHEVDDKTWNYWKFVWRSSLYLLVTASDHLWLTHFAHSGSVAA